MVDADQRAGIYLTRSGPPRTVVVGAACPTSMQRPGLWRVDDYDLHKQLYKGKASLLYSATCKVSGIHVALKLYRKPRLSDLNWFQVNREIVLHSSLHHDHIIDFYASFEDADNVYIVQEYAVGGDLYGELKRCGGRFKDKNVARDILLPCMQALQYCHQKGIIHRDIKPENILLSQRKSIKLADFGLSIDAGAERPVTRAGTLDYMAPEVLTCPEKSRPEENKDKTIFVYTQVVDAWAMGILAFECLSGKPPFERASRTETYEHIMYRKHACPSYFTKESSDFILKALNKVASKRPAIAELLEHPWIAQYMSAVHARIPAYHPAVESAVAEHAPTSVLDSGKALSHTGSASMEGARSIEPGSMALAETIRPGGPQHQQGRAGGPHLTLHAPEEAHDLYKHFSSGASGRQAPPSSPMPDRSGTSKRTPLPSIQVLTISPSSSLESNLESAAPLSPTSIDFPSPGPPMNHKQDFKSGLPSKRAWRAGDGSQDLLTPAAVPKATQFRPVPQEAANEGV